VTADRPTTLHDRLRELRLLAGYSTQPQAGAALRARGIEVSDRSVGAYETGQAKPPYRTLHALAAIYGASYSELCLLAVWS
jgi:transcriptional regulator with XRE-family HTH domain